MEDHPNLVLLSSTLGWVYFAAWSASFYPQIILNYRRKDVTGFSPDFSVTNPIGHFCLAIFNTTLFFSRTVRTQYAARHQGGVPQVSPADVAFALHATTLAIFTFFQTIYYPKPKEQRLSTLNKIILPLIALAVLAYGVVVKYSTSLQSLDWLYAVSYVKLWITFSKYWPQALLNYQRQSTSGWSIENVLCDFTGGLLSLVQLCLDSWLAKDFWGGTLGNPSKLGLSFFSLAFDLLFLVQHYILYRGADPILERREGSEVDEDEDQEQGTVDERTPLAR